ncbi:SDR family NAD(P)-dependent oxidoreductase [Macrococcus carouselicus]|uniref:SDR family NAD(P)-dependent oxidoreductase n=1 Tax=Macrococcus carouselicus TaxID=69969 RepID=A0A9Q8CPI6_9STAP|nr:SDR family NAD(P)-dependent oxidoreductase [Macrococcus carouselicus]TDM04305.1 SDR family NAD(P)-dependent oxidoreductase [Macrococcus carouselicus]
MIGKKYILTGGTGGLGQSLLSELIGRGATVLVLGRNERKLKVLQELYPQQLEVYLIALDDLPAVRGLAASLINKGETYDGIINNAGYGYFKSFADHSADEIVAMMNVNVTHPAVLLKELIPLVRPGASVVNIVSQSARVATPFGSVYAASKAALLSLSNALRLEYPDLHVMTVSTGPVETDFFSRADVSGHYSEKTKSIQLDCDSLAAQIVQAIADKKNEVNRPRWMHHSLTLYQIAPRAIEKLFRPLFLSKHD